VRGGKCAVVMPGVQDEFTGYRGVEKWALFRCGWAGGWRGFSTSEQFSEVDAAVDDLVAEGFVGALRRDVVDEGVGGHFCAAVAAGPGFGGGDQLAANALAAAPLVDIPAFDVADRVSRIAAVGVGAQTGFEESDNAQIGSFCDEMDERKAGGSGG
jgi:hypothetical protein